MGNHPSTQLTVSLPSRPNEWVVENRTQYCQLVRNTYTNQTAEQYVVPTPHGITLFNNLAQYQYRRTHHTNTVAVYHAEKQQGAYLCNGQDYLKVRIQRIPIRLSQMKGMKEIESIKVTLKMMEGFKILFEHFGGFHINDQMIGFNQKGEVKVWINSNFALNSVEFSPNLGNKVVSQADMVNQIFSLVQQHLQSQTFSNQFKENVLRKYPRTFDEAINLILMSQNKSSLNSSIRSIHQVKQVPLQIQTVSTQNLNKSFRKPFQRQQVKVIQNKPSYYHNTSSTSSFYQPQQRSVLHNPPSTIAKSRLINSPSNQNSQNIMFNHREPRHNFQQKTVKVQPEVVSRVQNIHQNEIIQEKGMNTHRSLIPKPHKAQQYLPVKPTVNKETRRHSLKSFKVQQNLINQNNRLRQTQNFIDKNIPKQFHSIDSTPNLNKMQSSSLKIPSTQQLKISHKVIELPQKTNLVHPVSTPQPKAPQFTFPKPSMAAQRMVIQKLEKSPQTAQLQIMNAMNNISGISSEHSRTISKFSTDRILEQIHHPFVQPHVYSPNNYVLSHDPMVSSRTGLVLKELQQPKTINSRSKYNLEENLHDQFSKTKIIPSTYDDKSDPSIKQRTIATPKFQSHSSSNEVNSKNLLSTDIQKLIQQHQADKKELLKKIEQYERVSRLNRINYDVSPTQPKQYQQTYYQKSKPSLSNKNIGAESLYKNY